MKKTFSAIFLVICVLITVFAPFCTVAEEPTEPAPAAMPKKPTSRSGAKAKLDIVVDDDD